MSQKRGQKSFITDKIFEKKVNKKKLLPYFQGGNGCWAVYYTTPPKFYNNVFLIVSLTTLGTY